MKNWTTIIVLLVLSGCAPKVISYLNENSKFETFESYRIVSAKAESKNVNAMNTQIFDLIKENITKEMEKRSFINSNVSPDLILRYEVTSSARTESNSTRDPFYPVYRINSRTIYESIILLELLDKNKKLVWQGSFDLRQERKEKKASKAIEKAIGYIFTSFPYRALSDQPDESLKN
ncbi:DUF4136 domain-containing protein [Ekhidna sp.]|uniref:DUF4136 domain-containing protein n=1 Tax=Ekhidna sp. TaxID=2608089 RepID=UPI003B50DE05